MAKEIILSGYVVSDMDAAWFGDMGGCISPQMVRDALAEIDGAATVRLNSDGGDPFAGEAIRSTLAQHPGGVTVIVEGIAASAASLIFMGAKTRCMSRGSILMIHDPSTMAWGTEAELMKQAAVTGQLADTYASVYGAAAGISTEEARAVMKAETWFSAQEAMDAGFCDQILDDLPAPEMTVAAGRMSFQKMTRSMVAMTARKGSGQKPVDAATVGGSPAVLANAEEAGMPNDLPAGAPAVLPQTTPEAAMLAERSRQREIRTMAEPFIASMALTTAQVEAEIDAGTSVADASTRFLSLMAASQPASARPMVRIVRDEVDTRRVGMKAALVSQISGRAPEDDRASAFMGMSIVEMAATCGGYKGSLRTAGDRINALMAGTHTTSDFTGIFENALNKALLDRYQVSQPTYRKIARKKNFNDFRVHPMVRAGDFPNLQPVPESGRIQFGTFGEKRETAILSPYAVGLTITRQMMINDEMGAIADVINDSGSQVAVFEEATFYAFMASATLASDGLAIWLTAATRANLASTGAAINVASLAAGKAAMRKQVGIGGTKLNLTPSVLLVGPDKEVEAQQLVASITPATAANVNPFSGKLEVVTSAELTGNVWHLFADPNVTGGQCFVYGYLNGAEAPRLRTEEPFGTQGWSMTLEHDFGLGAVDFRGTYRNPGA